MKKEKVGGPLFNGREHRDQKTGIDVHMTYKLDGETIFAQRATIL